MSTQYAHKAPTNKKPLPSPWGRQGLPAPCYGLRGVSLTQPKRGGKPFCTGGRPPRMPSRRVAGRPRQGLACRRGNLQACWRTARAFPAKGGKSLPGKLRGHSHGQAIGLVGEVRKCRVSRSKQSDFQAGAARAPTQETPVWGKRMVCPIFQRGPGPAYRPGAMSAYSAARQQVCRNPGHNGADERGHNGFPAFAGLFLQLVHLGR